MIKVDELFFKMLREKDIVVKFPLHFFVWNDNSSSLQESLKDNPQYLEQFDPRGRTPLMLAVTLERLECSKILLNHGANVNVENKEGWTGVIYVISLYNRLII